MKIQPAVVDQPPGAPVERSGRLGLLGSFRLEVEGQRIPVPGGGQRLIALLALRGPTSRSRVSGTLWPDSPQTQAMTNLRHVLWRLQGSPAGPTVLATGHELHLSPWLEVDTVRLVADSRRVLQDGRLPELGASDELLRADAAQLLPEWDDEWLDDERERLHQLRLHLLEAWAESLTQWGRFGLALDVALVALRADVLRESAHRAVIKVHRAEGNVGEARRAFELCRRILVTEVGVAPSAETAALVP